MNTALAAAGNQQFFMYLASASSTTTDDIFGTYSSIFVNIWAEDGVR